MLCLYEEHPLWALELSPSWMVHVLLTWATTVCLMRDDPVPAAHQ